MDRPANSSSRTLYRRLLGEHYNLLPISLQNFHNQVLGATVTGSITVEHRPDPLRRFCAALLRLPPAGHNFPLRLETRVEGEKERWLRSFGTYRLETLQWQEGEFLIEKNGPVEFIFKVSATRDGLSFAFQGNRHRGRLLPHCFTMPVHAEAVGQENGWRINVNIHSTLLGPLATYYGEVTPLSAKE